MRNRECGHDHHQRTPASKWNHEAEHEQQMVDAAEDVRDAELDESPCGVIPARVEAYEPGVADVLVRALRAVWRDETQHRRRLQAEARELGTQGEVRPFRLHRIVEDYVDGRLLPRNVRRRIERRAEHARHGRDVGGERSIRWNRDSRREDAPVGQALAILVRLYEL